jgi:urease accessory protein
MSQVLALTRLLQLASPLLPVGAFAYSQGLEAAVEDGSVRDAETARRWILDCLQYGLARFEAPILLRLMAACSANDVAALHHWNTRFLASRESAELHAETVQMGFSLRRLLLDLDPNKAEDFTVLQAIEPLSYPAAYAFAAVRWNAPPRDALTAYLWSWCENQVSASLKAVPLGQVAGQRILVAAQQAVEQAVEHAATVADQDLANLLPALAIASARHETQYSRLFRS